MSAIKAVSQYTAALLWFTIALTQAVWSASASDSNRIKDAGQDLLLCYRFAAIKYALQTCEPSAAIVMAVYGKCDTPERAYRHALELDKVNDPLFSEAVINELRKMAEPKIYELILDTRANSPSKCP